jgi:hypothetical protein
MAYYGYEYFRLKKVLFFAKKNKTFLALVCLICAGVNFQMIKGGGSVDCVKNYDLN